MKTKLFSKLPKISTDALESIKNGIEENRSISDLEQLGVSQRLINLLESNGISKLEDLMNKKKEELISMPNFGEKQLEILFKALSNYHYID
jgi:DNA-directed RNA polymerase alpha subunit